MAVFHSDSEAQTAKIAAELAANVQDGDIFLLNGNLGAGKSVFARAFIRTLCGENTDVPSPTFTLVQTYDSAKGTLWHFDLYRLKDPEEIYEIGWEDAIFGGITLVEWPERLGARTPPNARRITIDITSADQRKITIDEA